MPTTWTTRSPRFEDEAVQMRVLGVDLGERRIGLAVSDPTGTLATPLETVARRPGKRPPLTRLEEIARGLGVEHLVLGLPLDPLGHENDWCAEVRDVGHRLADRLGVGVSFVDERHTSARAERAVRSLGLPRRRREEKGRVDAAAAQLILQSWLDRPEVAR
jgi:putative Holliday junction resolvase